MERSANITTGDYRALLESAVPTLSDFSIGFALPSAKDGSIDACLGGSGTLVTIDAVQGILTANHVIERLRKNRFVGLILPTRFEPKIHHLSLEMQHCSHVSFAFQGQEADWPDFGLLIPPPSVLSALKARKSFYNLSNRQERMLGKPPAVDHGFWVLSGLAAEWTNDLSPESGYSKVKQFRGLHGAGVAPKECHRGTFDYFIYEVLYNDLYEGPDDYGGFSGGGLWQLLVKPNGNKLQIADWLLSGVAWYESKKKNDAGQITREITCHGRRSLYQALIDKVRAGSS